MEFSENYKKLFQTIYDLYHKEENKSKLLFHGWHHIKFVHDKAIEFANELKADAEKAACSALVHDLNYIFTEVLEPEAANVEIKKYLMEAGYSEEFANEIIQNIEDGHLGYRGARKLSEEAKALADADTLFKALPTTPILFASRFITQNKYSIEKLANKVVGEQEPLIEEGNYFYSEMAKKKYMTWAKVNVYMWKNVQEALKDPAISEMLQTATELGIL